MKLNEQRAKNWKHLSKKFNSKEGVIKINVHNTIEHELAKFMLCWNLAKKGKQFITEAIFTNNKRADIYCLDTGEAYEILHSESIEDFKKNKTAEYPVPVFAFKSQDVLKGKTNGAI